VRRGGGSLIVFFMVFTAAGQSRHRHKSFYRPLTVAL